jgi:predicted DNA binding CopG/RHH family protein
MKNKRIFLPKEDYEKLERSASKKGLTVQEFVNTAVAKLLPLRGENQ